MSTRPFKDIEQMMREAADGFEQPFDDESWRKMEKLLDKEKERKRPVIWLWWLIPAFLLGGGSVYFYFEHILPTNSSPGLVIKPSATKKTNVVDLKTASRTAGEPNKKQLPAEVDDNHHKSTIGEPSKKQLPADDDDNYNKSTAGDTHLGVAKQRIADAVVVYPKHKNIPADYSQSRLDKKALDAKTKVSTAAGEVSIAEVPEAKSSATSKELPTEMVTEPLISASAAAPKPIDNTIVSSQKTKAGIDKRKTKNSRWYIIAGAGLDGSGTKMLALDQLTAKAGGTFGYQLTPKLSLQTGFFTSHKKYVAGPSDYYAKAGSYWSTVDITRIKANCLVYEIPLNIRYDFQPGKPTRVFALAGLSSYIMQKEDYQYSYNRYGYPHSAAAAYRGNNHAFSVLRIGAGVEKQINNSFSFVATPALSIPLAGVGEGRVKLYSAEFLVGVRYQLQKNVR